MDVRVEDVELDNKGKPLADKGIDETVEALVAISVFLLSANLGFHAKGLSHMPLVAIPGYVAGFLLIFICWLGSFVFAGLLLGKFSWANSLFLLVNNAGFRNGIGLLCITFFIARILSGTFRIMPYAKKETLCSLSLVFLVVNAIVLFISFPDKAKFCFVYLVAFMLYASFVKFNRLKIKSAEKPKGRTRNGGKNV